MSTRHPLARSSTPWPNWRAAGSRDKRPLSVRVSDAGPARAVDPGKGRGPTSESLRRTNPRDSGEQLAVYGELIARRRTARPARRRERDLNDDDPCRLVAAFIRRNFSFPAPCPFYSAIGRRRHDITDQSSVRPSAALATPSLQSSAPFSPRQSAQNHPLPTPPRDQFPIDGQLLAAVPRVRSSEAFGRRPLGPHPGRLLAPGRHPKP